MESKLKCDLNGICSIIIICRFYPTKPFPTIQLMNSNLAWLTSNPTESSGLQSSSGWSLLITILLHVLILSMLHFQPSMQQQNPPPSEPQRITVSLPPAPSMPSMPKLAHTANRDDSHEIVRKSVQVSEVHSTSEIAPVNDGKSETSETDGTSSLNIEHLLNQAKRITAEQPHEAVRQIDVTGDYYGTYSGDADSGTFFVHVDQSYKALGSGQSRKLGVNFTIRGSATSGGIIKMNGTGVAGGAHFQGQLDVKTGRVSGTWSAGAFGHGTFEGKHE